MHRKLLGPVNTTGVVSTGDNFCEFKERGVMHTGCLLATSDDEIGKLARPFRAGGKSGPTSFFPSTVAPPQPSGSASSPPHGRRPIRGGPGSGPIFSRNAIHPVVLTSPRRHFSLR